MYPAHSISFLCTLGLTVVLLAAISTVTSAQECEVAKLVAQEGTSREHFGRSVSVDGDVMIVAAPGGSLVCDPGEARVFRWDGTIWVLEQILTPSNSVPYADFGSSVTVSGDVAVVGTPRDDGQAPQSGAAYVYRYDVSTSTWFEEQKLTASDGGVSDRYGCSVSVSGDVVVVGAARDDDMGGSSGASYVYRYDVGTLTWLEEQKLTASDGAASDSFGVSVSVSEDAVVIGAPYDDDFGDNSGAAYAYRYDVVLDAWVEEQKLTAANGAAGDLLGGSVSVSGGAAVVGAAGDDDLGDDSGASYVYRYDVGTSTWLEEQKLTASDGESGDLLGTSVSVDGDVVVAVATQCAEPECGPCSSGAAYVYRYDPIADSWAQEQKLTSSAGNFGSSISVSEGVTVVGSMPCVGSWCGGRDGGSVYVFRHDAPSGAWLEAQELTTPRGEGDLFGSAVSVSGDVAVVSAPSDNELSPYSGSAHLYRYDGAGSTWIKQQELTASDAAANDEFGNSVAVSGDVAVVGAPQCAAPGDCGCGAGAAYVYLYDSVSETWIEEQKLTASDGVGNDGFGASVSVSGDVVVVGAPYDDDLGGGSGAVYVYRYDAGTSNWNEEQKLTASDGAFGNEFGFSVSADGDLVLVGADQWPNCSMGCSPVGPGAAYVFRFDGVQWLEEEKLTASDGAESDNFGRSVTVSGDAVVVGAEGDDDLGNESGAAYVYRYDASTLTWFEEQKLMASDGAEYDNFGWSVSVSGDVVVVGAPGVDNSGSSYIYRYYSVSGNWIEEQKLTSPDGAPGDRFGSAASVSADAAFVGAPGDDDACLPIECSSCDSGAAYVFDLAACTLPPDFIRGDADGNGIFNGLADGLHLLTYGFLDGPPPPCMEASDADGNALQNPLADAMYILTHSFLGGPPPLPPYPSCGSDPDPGGSLGCFVESCP